MKSEYAAILLAVVLPIHSQLGSACKGSHSPVSDVKEYRTERKRRQVNKRFIDEVGNNMLLCEAIVGVLICCGHAKI